MNEHERFLTVCSNCGYLLVLNQNKYLTNPKQHGKTRTLFITCTCVSRSRTRTNLENCLVTEKKIQKFRGCNQTSTSHGWKLFKHLETALESDGNHSMRSWTNVNRQMNPRFQWKKSWGPLLFFSESSTVNWVLTVENVPGLGLI